MNNIYVTANNKNRVINQKMKPTTINTMNYFHLRKYVYATVS